VLAWALYDVSSSAFAASVPTFFGLYFVTTIGHDLPGAQGRWGAIASLALVLAGGLAPFVGARADLRGRWLGALVVATGLCVVATVSMPDAGRDNVPSPELFVPALARTRRP
jgi:UMF1 family MFS transporter